MILPARPSEPLNCTIQWMVEFSGRNFEELVIFSVSMGFWFLFMFAWKRRQTIVATKFKI